MKLRTRTDTQMQRLIRHLCAARRRARQAQARGRTHASVRWHARLTVLQHGYRRICEREARHYWID